MKVEIETSEDSESKKYGKYEKWEIESAANTLKEAEEIKADAEKMKYVKMCMQEKMKSMKKAISSLDDIRLARAELMDEETEYSDD